MTDPIDMPSGIDVASYQGAVDWRVVRTMPVDFAFVKATGGSRYVNPTFDDNWQGIRDAGLTRGAYHYAFETTNTPFPGPGPEAEAAFFLDRIAIVGGLEPGDLLALDLEDGEGDLGEWALRWLRYVEHEVGYKPLFYSGEWFMSPHGIANYPELAEYGLWLSADTKSMPEAPAPWDFVAFWQHAEAGNVPGVTGKCDLNVFNGPLERLRLYGMPDLARPPLPPLPPPPAPPDTEGISEVELERRLWRAELTAILDSDASGEFLRSELRRLAARP